MSKVITAIRGTLQIIVDTNFYFNKDFQGRYKGVDFVYIWGGNDKADCVVSCIVPNVEETYFLISEFISLLSYSLDKSFLLRDSGSDSYRGDLLNRRPAVGVARMHRYDIESSAFQSGFPIIKCLPKIDTKEQSNLARLYRIAKTSEHINPISSFLFYFHILDFPIENCDTGIAASYINKFYQENKDKNIADAIIEINQNRVFEKNGSDGSFINKNYDDSLGDYIEKKVRGSVGHIVRYDKSSAHDLIVDSFEQSAHFNMLNRLMREIARHKLDNAHHFNIDCFNEYFSWVK